MGNIISLLKSCLSNSDDLIHTICKKTLSWLLIIFKDTKTCLMKTFISLWNPNILNSVYFVLFGRFCSVRSIANGKYKRPIVNRTPRLSLTSKRCRLNRSKIECQITVYYRYLSCYKSCSLIIVSIKTYSTVYNFWQVFD